MLRITLNNEFMGPQQTMEAIGINEVVQNIKRDEQADGVFFSLILNLQFIKKERVYIQQAFELYGGPDANVSVLVELENPNTYKFETYFIGSIDFALYNLTEDSVSVNIVQGIGFQEKVLNGMDKQINLETLASEDGTALPPMLVVNSLPLHSKTIKRQTVLAGPSVPLGDAMAGYDTIGGPKDIYFIYGYDSTEIDEIKDVFSYQTFFMPPNSSLGSTNKPVDSLFYTLKVKEAGLYSINIRIPYTIKTNLELPFDYLVEFYCYIYHPDGTFSGDTIESIGGVGATTASGVALYNPAPFTLIPGDVIYIYGYIRYTGPALIPDTIKLLQKDGEPLSITITANTTFPTSTCKSVLLHEAVKKCIQYLTGQSDCFKSDLLGRTDIGYATDGDGSLIIITNGRLIRKAISFSITRSGDLKANLNQLIEFINAVFCIGWGFETIDGVLKFVIERKSYWYDKNTEAISLGKIPNIKSKLNLAAYFNTFIFGYSTKMEKNEINSIDEFNTLREYSIPITNTKNKLNVSTEMKVSGYQIEQQRRLVNSSEDSKLDEELFAIVVIRDGGSFRSKKNEGYNSILNVFDSPTGYNYDISPARCLENWLPFISNILTRSFNKTIKFSSGETNFLMSSKKDTESDYLYENGDVNLTNVTPIYDSLIYEAGDFAFSKDQVELIKLNPKGYWSFQDRFGFTFKGFLNSKGLEHNSNLGKAVKMELTKLV